jgi:hypothetical protein
MKVSFSGSGDFRSTAAFLNKIKQLNIDKIVAAEAEKGVAALASATPADSGLAASSWGYEIVKTSKSLTVHWTNSDTENGYPVAVMIQYGHGTGTGGYVQGIDYINPAIRPIFDQIAETVWKAVTSA